MRKRSSVETDAKFETIADLSSVEENRRRSIFEGLESEVDEGDKESEAESERSKVKLELTCS